MNMLSHSNSCTAAPECGEPFILAVTGDDRSHNEGHRDQFDIARRDTKKPRLHRLSPIAQSSHTRANPAGRKVSVTYGKSLANVLWML